MEEGEGSSSREDGRTRAREKAQLHIQPTKCTHSGRLNEPPCRKQKRRMKRNAVKFWRTSNNLHWTQHLFNDFIQEITNISRRIRSEEASQEDYDLALKVLKTSGKLEELVTRQQKVFEEKQMELQKAAASMQNIDRAMR